jgi:hypothetical protein
MEIDRETGTISQSLVSRLRADLGGSRRRGSKPQTSSEITRAVADTKRGRRTNREQLLHQIEGDLDRMIFALMKVGGLEDVEAVLRRARRTVVLSQEA